MIVTPLYSFGIFPKQCLYCRRFTQERVGHQVSEIKGFSELEVYTLSKIPTHRACHDQFCADERRSVGQSVPPEECGLCGIAYARDEEHRCSRLVEAKSGSASPTEMDLLTEIAEPIV